MRAALTVTSWLACVLAISSLPMPAVASPVSPTDLFLAPSAVPDDFYPSTSFEFGASSDVFVNILPADVGAISFTAVHILPVLNPDPTTTDGAYTAADLAAINAGNFGAYFFRLPGTQYTADLTSSQIAIDYKASGEYIIQVQGIGPDGAISTILDHHVDDFFAEDPAHGKKDKAGPSRTITNPSADLILLSDGDPNDNGFLKEAADHMTNAGIPFKKVKSIAETTKAIKDAFDANGGHKMKVVLMGHGFGLPQGGIKIGKEYITNIGGFTTPTAFQKMVDQWVNNLELWSCNTGQDRTLLQDLANSIGSASGFATTLTVASPSLLGLFSGYFDQGALGKKADAVVPVPEPGSAWLIAYGMTVLALYRGKRVGA